jgi:hypothetical protein
MEESYNRHHDPQRWRFIYDGPAAASGDGHDIDVLEAVRSPRRSLLWSTLSASMTTQGSTTASAFATGAMSHTAASTGT